MQGCDDPLADPPLNIRSKALRMKLAVIETLWQHVVNLAGTMSDYRNMEEKEKQSGIAHPHRQVIFIHEQQNQSRQMKPKVVISAISYRVGCDGIREEIYRVEFPTRNCSTSSMTLHDASPLYVYNLHIAPAKTSTPRPEHLTGVYMMRKNKRKVGK